MSAHLPWSFHRGVRTHSDARLTFSTVRKGTEERLTGHAYMESGVPDRLGATIRIFTGHKDMVEALELWKAASLIERKWPESGVTVQQLREIQYAYPEGLVLATMDSAWGPPWRNVVGVRLVIRKNVKNVEKPEELAVPLDALTNGRNGNGYFAGHEPDGNAFVGYVIASTMHGVAELMGRFVAQMGALLVPNGNNRFVGSYSRAPGYAKERDEHGTGIIRYLGMDIDPVVDTFHRRQLGGEVLFVLERGRRADPKSADMAPIIRTAVMDNGDIFAGPALPMRHGSIPLVRLK